MINSVELMKHKNEKLTKMNRILNASVQRNIKGDWKNKFYALEEEATLESQSLKAQIRAMKPISKDTKKEYDVVLKAQTKELNELTQEVKKLKKQLSDNDLEMREYQERVLGEYGDDAEALEPKYHRLCGWCGDTYLGINEHIFIYEKEGVEEMTLCKECGEPNPYHTSPYSQLKKQGYTCDQEEEEKCEECGKALEGDDKCGAGCPAYDKGWAETHPSSEEE